MPGGLSWVNDQTPLYQHRLAYGYPIEIGRLQRRDLDRKIFPVGR